MDDDSEGYSDDEDYSEDQDDEDEEEEDTKKETEGEDQEPMVTSSYDNLPCYFSPALKQKASVIAIHC